MTPESVDRHEKRVRPGASSSLVAARKLCEAMDFDPSPRRHELSGKAIHLATGMGWGPVYGLLRRYAGLRPVTAALASGTSMSLILEEYLVPALGLSAPNHRYPNFTRARGLVAHLVYGLRRRWRRRVLSACWDEPLRIGPEPCVPRFGVLEVDRRDPP